MHDDAFINSDTSNDGFPCGYVVVLSIEVPLQFYIQMLYTMPYRYIMSYTSIETWYGEKEKSYYITSIIK